MACSGPGLEQPCGCGGCAPEASAPSPRQAPTPRWTRLDPPNRNAKQSKPQPSGNRGWTAHNRRFMDAWKRRHASGKGQPQRNAQRARTPEEHASLCSALEACPKPFLIFEPSGKVIFHLAAGYIWLRPLRRGIAVIGQPIRIPAHFTRLSARSPYPSRAPEGAPAAGDEGGASPRAAPLPKRLCAESFTFDVSVAWVTFSWTITGKTVFPDTGALPVSAVDWMTVLAMFTYDLPNCSVGIVNGAGRLQHARGYTNLHLWAEVVDDEPDWHDGPFIACPNTLYRIASLTKPITAFAVKRMILDGAADRYGDPIAMTTPFRWALPNDAHSLTPDEVFVKYFPEPMTSSTWDTIRYIDDITIKDLMLHAAGWCENDFSCAQPTSDPHEGMEQLVTDDARLVSDWNSVYGYGGDEFSIPIDRAMRVLYAFSAAGFARINGPRKWVQPYTQNYYSNFGYMLLGRVLEKGMGTPVWTGWYDAVRSLVLEPLGMNNTFAARPGHDEPYVGEAPYWVNDLVRYWDEPSVLSSTEGDDGDVDEISKAYGGGRRIDHTDAAAGLVSTIMDYCRFLTDQRLFDLYDPSADPTGRLWKVLSRNDVVAMRSVTYYNRTLAWFCDSSNTSEVAFLGDDMMSSDPADTVLGMVDIPASRHTGTWAGTSASAYLFPPNTGLMTENVGVAVFANSNIPNDVETVDIAQTLAWTIAKAVEEDGFEWSDTVDYFDDGPSW